jgi:phosphatidylinositol alpha 1,6-mannosyltransferase
MRIALITETFLPNVNGVVTTLCRLLEYLQRQGHAALVFAPEGTPTEYAGAQIVPLAGQPLPIYPELQLTLPQLGFSQHIQQFQPDLIHLAGPAMLGSTGRFLAERFQVPLIAAYHTDFPAYTNHYGIGWLRESIYSYLRWVHNGCALTLCPSSATMADLRRHGFRRLRLWGRGVDTERFHPCHRSAAFRAAAGIQSHETMLLYVGRIAHEKRLELLADAIDGLHNVRLVLVGDGPARSALEQRLAGKPVHFAGYLHGEALAEAYASADLFTFPSDTETFGQVLQEAMASGLPVVAARAGGAIDLISQANGRLFAPGVSGELRQHIVELANQRSMRIAMGMAGRAMAESRSWPSIMDALMSHYWRVLQLNHRRSSLKQRKFFDPRALHVEKLVR